MRVVDAMGDQYPELRERREHIASVAEGEEVRFRQTIERGLSLLEERFDIMADEHKTTLAGADAFKLYDTYGFPLDLTNVICSERGFEVDDLIEHLVDEPAWLNRRLDVPKVGDILKDFAPSLGVRKYPPTVSAKRSSRIACRRSAAQQH